MTTVLITGGAGYVGSHIAAQLLDRGDNVIITDDFRNSYGGVIGRLEDITGRLPKVYALDLCLPETSQEIFQNNQVDVVIHAAGLKSVPDSTKSPLSYYKNNMASTFALVEAMLDYGVHNLIFSSSASVYGSPEVLPIMEDNPYACVSPYARTKMAIELFLKDIAEAKEGMSILALRYFNPIGAHPSGLIGDAPKGQSNSIMSALAKVIIGGCGSIQIYGNDYPTEDGTGVRDYIHVQDLARGHSKAVDYLMGECRESGFEAVNLGTGAGYSTLSLVRWMEAHLGRPIPVQFAERRAGDVAVCYADVKKAESLLGWKAEHDLADMCRDSLKWIRREGHAL